MIMRLLKAFSQQLKSTLLIGRYTRRVTMRKQRYLIL